MINTGAELKGIYNTIKALGNKAVASDATMVIEGYESISLLIKQFPWPILTPQGEIEIATPLGGGMWQPQQVKVHQQGSITIVETADGKVAKFLEELNATKGARFNAKMFEGTQENHSRSCRIFDAFFQLDNPDRDHESRSQVLQYTGTMFFHYFGDEA